MKIIGIDPGASGGVAYMDTRDFGRTVAYSLKKFTLVDLIDLLRGLEDEQVQVYLENPNLPMFNKHTQNNFNVQAHSKLNRSIGQLEGVCIACGRKPVLISPIKWQNRLQCRTKGDKNVSKRKAIQCFPFMTKVVKSSGEEVSRITHDIADALLIALYGYLENVEARYIPRHLRSIDDGEPIKSKRPRPVPVKRSRR